MRKTYQIARMNELGQIIPFGPLMTLDKAESYAADMEKGGFAVMIVNRETF